MVSGPGGPTEFSWNNNLVPGSPHWLSGSGNLTKTRGVFQQAPFFIWNFFVYILFSRSIDSFYIGQSIDPALRLEEHNLHLMNRAFTKRADDWEIFFTIQCESRKQAILIEKNIKKMKSRKYLTNLKEDSDMVTKLLKKFKWRFADEMVPGSSR